VVSGNGLAVRQLKNFWAKLTARIKQYFFVDLTT
jgi:hypothetical protein